MAKQADRKGNKRRQGKNQDEANPAPPAHRMVPGPDSIGGLEASELPDKGRGSVDENVGKTLGRKTPDRTGGTPQETGGNVGIRAMPDDADAFDHGHRKHN